MTGEERLSAIANIALEWLTEARRHAEAAELCLGEEMEMHEEAARIYRNCATRLLEKLREA